MSSENKEDHHSRSHNPIVLTPNDGILNLIKLKISSLSWVKKQISISPPTKETSKIQSSLLFLYSKKIRHWGKLHVKTPRNRASVISAKYLKFVSLYIGSYTPGDRFKRWTTSTKFQDFQPTKSKFLWVYS